MQGRAAAVSALLFMIAFSGCLQADQGATGVAPSDVAEGERTARGPTLDFSWTPAAPTTQDLVQFTPEGTKPEGTEITDWSWGFGDGGRSAAGSPAYRFQEPGLYEVAVTMALSDGQQVAAERVLAVAAAADEPVSEGPATPEGPDAPRVPPVVVVDRRDLGVVFGFTWTHVPDDVAWDFGDGSTSKELAPEHIFASAGSYEVRLNVQWQDLFFEVLELIVVGVDPPTFRISPVGESGAEPSIGITSSGCIFFQAFARTMRSCDAGSSWSRVDDLFGSPITNDPWLWVDRDTDRIFAAHQLGVGCVWLAWSDDDGDSWLGNPWDCGPTPVVDHFKVGTGPWTGPLELIGTNPVYPNAVYLCYNKVAGSWCTVSADGGATFPASSVASVTVSGQHGAIETGPNGTVYLPLRWGGLLSYDAHVAVSRDNGVTWEDHDVGRDVGSADPLMNPEVATDTAGNAYIDWQGRDNGLYLARSTDQGATWSQSFRITPPEIGTTAFPTLTAGDPGRIAAAYLGAATADHGDEAAPDTRWDLYVTFSLNALDPEPDFFTVQVTDDPVQVGSIQFGGGSDPDRNLLDFIDLHIDDDGRVYVAYADGCTGACSTKVHPSAEASRDDAGMVAILWDGPSLYDVERLGPPR